MTLALFLMGGCGPSPCDLAAEAEKSRNFAEAAKLYEECDAASLGEEGALWLRMTEADATKSDNPKRAGEPIPLGLQAAGPMYKAAHQYEGLRGFANEWAPRHITEIQKCEKLEGGGF